MRHAFMTFNTNITHLRDVSLRSPWSRRSQPSVASRARRDPAPPARGVISEREDVQPPSRLLRERELVRPADVDGAVDDRRRRAHDSIVRQEAPNSCKNVIKNKTHIFYRPNGVE